MDQIRMKFYGKEILKRYNQIKEKQCYLFKTFSVRKSKEKYYSCKDKRKWELYGCNDTVCKKIQKIPMFKEINKRIIVLDKNNKLKSKQTTLTNWFK